MFVSLSRICLAAHAFAGWISWTRSGFLQLHWFRMACTVHLCCYCFAGHWQLVGRRNVHYAQVVDLPVCLVWDQYKRKFQEEAPPLGSMISSSQIKQDVMCSIALAVHVCTLSFTILHAITMLLFLQVFPFVDPLSAIPRIMGRLWQQLSQRSRTSSASPSACHVIGLLSGQQRLLVWLHARL